MTVSSFRYNKPLNFPLVRSYRSNSSLEKVIGSWLRFADDGSGRRFKSRSHFLRAAVLSFDSLLKKSG